MRVRAASGAGRCALRILLFTAVLIVGRATPLRADESHSLDALARGADVVMLGRCVAATSAWDDNGRVIITRVTLQPTTLMKGTAGGEIVVHVLGGTVDGISMAASHGASIIDGEQAVYFLRRSVRGAHYVVHGGSAGKLVVDESNRGRVKTADGRRLNLADVAAAVRGSRE